MNNNDFLDLFIKENIIISIDFVTKKIIYKNLNKSIKSKYEIEGTSFYILDKSLKKLKFQFPFLKTGEYKPNSFEVAFKKNKKTGKLTGTSAWNDIKKDRIKIFGNIEKNISEKEVRKLSKNQINEINKLFLSTVLNLEKFLSGSNSSGSDFRPSSSPFWTNFNENYINFVNVFKHSFKNETMKSLNKNIKKQFILYFDNFKKVYKFLKNNSKNFKEFINDKKLNNNFLLNLKVFNPLTDFDLEVDFKKTNIEIKNMSKQIKLNFKKNKNIEEYRKDVEKFIKNKIDNFKNKEKDNLKLEKEKLIQNLRRIFSINLRLESSLKNNEESYVEKDENYYDLEAAHIFPVSESIKNEKFFEIADYNNGLLISPNLHTAYDNGKIEIIKENKNFYLLIKIKKIKLKIKESILSNQRKEYLVKN